MVGGSTIETTGLSRDPVWGVFSAALASSPIGPGKPVRGYYRKAFDKTFSAYIDQAHKDSSGTLEQSASSKDSNDFQSGTRDDACSTSNPAQTQAGSGLFQRSTSSPDRAGEEGNPPSDDEIEAALSRL